MSNRAKHMSAVIAIGNLGFGVGMVATLIGLVVGAAATNLVLYCIIATKNAANAMNAHNKFNQILCSMVEFRKEVEAKASRVKCSPGAVLLDIIHNYASKLNEQLAKLRERSAELLPTSMQNLVQAATIYVQQQDDTFIKAQSIDQVKQEVFGEAEQKMHEIAGWTIAVIMRNGQSPKVAKQNGSVDSNGGR